MTSWMRRRWWMPIVAVVLAGLFVPSAFGAAGAEPFRDESAIEMAPPGQISPGQATFTLLVLGVVIVGGAAVGVRTWQQDRRRVVQRMEAQQSDSVVRRRLTKASDSDRTCGEDAEALETVPVVG